MGGNCHITCNLNNKCLDLYETSWKNIQNRHLNVRKKCHAKRNMDLDQTMIKIKKSAKRRFFYGLVKMNNICKLRSYDRSLFPKYRFAFDMARLGLIDVFFCFKIVMNSFFIGCKSIACDIAS
jgi:hypothetical protein